MKILENVTPKRFVAVICSIFIIIGTLICIDGIGIILRANETYSWHKTSGFITSSEIIDYKWCYTRRHEGCHVNIQYKYMVDSKNYNGNSIFIGEHRVNAKNFAIVYGEQYLFKYPAGSQAFVYYDPNNPQNATLQRGLSKLTFTGFKFGLLFAFDGVLITLVYYFAFQKLGKLGRPEGFILVLFACMVFLLSKSLLI